jgi:hypothetical protein
MKTVLLSLVKAYRRWISPLLLPSCRFQPTCSAYSLEAIEKFGAFWGSYLTIKRILACNPFGPSGYDPVPDKIDRHHH